jgi:hypothetical protein
MQYVREDGSGVSPGPKGLTMNSTKWIISGVLGTSLALAPALVASAQQTSQQTPTPGQQGDWGQAGPPPDVQNGQIPPPDSAAQDQDQNADQGPPQYPAQANQDPGQAPSAPAAGAGVGYGQPARPAYQPGQGAPNGYQGPQGPPQAAPPSGPVTLSSGMLLSIRTSEPLDSKRVKPGDFFQGTVAQSVYVGNVLAIPRGATVTGRVVDVKKPGELKGGASMALQLTALSLGGNSYSLATDTFNTNSPGKGGYTAGNTVGAAALGAAIGAVAGGGPGAAIGAVAGTGVGLGASAATPGPRSVVPPESLLAFHLTSPAIVQPVSYQDASRLEANSAPPAGRYGQRPPYGYGAPAGYAPPPPGYAPYPYAYGYPYPYVYAYPRPYVYGYPYYYRRWR